MWPLVLDTDENIYRNQYENVYSAAHMCSPQHNGKLHSVLQF